jgi:hypothetical protein
MGKQMFAVETITAGGGPRRGPSPAPGHTGNEQTAEHKSGEHLFLIIQEQKEHPRPGIPFGIFGIFRT